MRNADDEVLGKSADELASSIPTSQAISSSSAFGPKRRTSCSTSLSLRSEALRPTTAAFGRPTCVPRCYGFALERPSGGEPVFNDESVTLGRKPL